MVVVVAAGVTAVVADGDGETAAAVDIAASFRCEQQYPF